MPTSMIAAISSEVATGRRMKMRDGFTRRSAVAAVHCRIGPSPGHSPPRPAVAAAAGVGAGAAPAAAAVPAGAAAAPACAARDTHLGAVLQPVGAVDDNHLPRLQPVGDRDPLAVARTQLHRLHRDRIVRLDEVDKGAGGAALDRSGRDRPAVAHRVDQQLELTNWFAKQRLVGIVEDARSLTVPVVVSIWLSTVSRVPVASLVVPVRSKAVTASAAPARIRRITAGRSSSGNVKMTEIGCSCVMTTMPPASLVWT